MFDSIYFSIAYELFFGYCALFALTKILGKTQITQLSAFDFISALVLGELVGNAMYDKDISLLEILFAVTFWGALIYTTEWVTQKSIPLRLFLEGSPSIIIHKGIIIRSELAKNHLDLNQLQHLLRSKGAFTFKEVEYAILETDGTVSVLKKAELDCPSKSDLQIQTSPSRIGVTLISDGVLLKNNLAIIKKDTLWLEDAIHSAGFPHHNKVFYAEFYDDEEPLFIQGFTG